jgi:hypothetical protein
VGNLLQVMSLVAVPVLILGTIGYLNRRANRRPIEGARRHGDAPVPIWDERRPRAPTQAGRYRQSRHRRRRCSDDKGNRCPCRAVLGVVEFTDRQAREGGCPVSSEGLLGVRERLHPTRRTACESRLLVAQPRTDTVVCAVYVHALEFERRSQVGGVQYRSVGG